MVIAIGIFVGVCCVLIVAFGRYHIDFQLKYLSGQMNYRTFICPWCQFFNFEYCKEGNAELLRVHFLQKKLYQKQLHSNRFVEGKKVKIQQDKDRIKKYRNYLRCFRQFQNRLLRIVKHIVQGFQFKQFHLKGKVGLQNPSNTGIIFGTIQSVQYLFSDRINIDITPDFDQQKLEFYFNFQIQCILFILLCRIILAAINTGWVYFRCRLVS